MIDVSTLLEPVIAIARQAGEKIMAVYATDFSASVAFKADNSPVTEADTSANDHIVRALHELTPTLPIISEESLDVSDAARLAANELWLVDPLDGTKDFLQRGNEFTVNIALIRDHQPVLGVVYAPALNLLYYAALGQGAFKQDSGGKPVRLQVSKHDRQPVITVSRFHFNQETQDWLDAFGPHTVISAGSSLKFCYIADGKADIYPRLGPVMEWDIAASDIILREAGGSIVQQTDSKSPAYNKPDLHQPPFIAQG